MNIQEAWDAVEGKSDNKLYPYQAAEQLGMSEAEFYLTRVGDSVTVINADVKTFLEAVARIGKLKVITRNPHAVHEKIGTMSKIQVDKMHALVLDKEIDLRIFPRSWKTAVAYTSVKDEQTTLSFHVFDSYGRSVFKVYPLENLDIAEAVRDEIALPAPASFAVEALAASVPNDAPAVDVETLEQDWLSITDPHQFMGVLRKHKLNRPQAYDVVADDLAYRVQSECIKPILEDVAEHEIPIMVFVGNDGCIQIHTGPVSNVKAHGPWMNVLDETFHLHVKEADIAYAYVVSKPAEKGRRVTSLECFNKDHDIIISIYGERKPGVDELQSWRDALQRLRESVEDVKGVSV